MEGKLRLGVILLVPDTNQKTNLTDLQRYKVQQEYHLGIDGI